MVEKALGNRASSNVVAKEVERETVEGNSGLRSVEGRRLAPREGNHDYDDEVSMWN